MPDIQNASDLTKLTADKFIIQGPSGSGKSTIAATLPGKTLVLLLDPAGRSAYEGHPHIDVIVYEIQMLDITPYSLTKAVRQGQVADPVTHGKEPETYMRFGRDWEELWNTGKFMEYDNVVVDSITTLSALAMDYVQAKNNRYGQPPQIDDYTPQMIGITKVFRVGTMLPMRVVFIMHEEMVQDGLTQKIVNQPLVTGKLKSQLPILVNHHLRCEAVADPTTKKTKFLLQVRPDRYTPAIKSSFKGLDERIDVTITDFKNVQTQGLGKVLKEQQL